MTWLIDKLTGLFGGNWLLWIAVIAACLGGVFVGVGLTRSATHEAREELARARAEWEAERHSATARALGESEAQRAREKALAEKLTLAMREHDNAKNRLTAVIADRNRLDVRLRNAQAALAAAADRQGQLATPACRRAADATIAALGSCAEQYRHMARQHGECLAGMQVIEQAWDAARAACR